jgi:anti-sigma B factor antagonist
MKLEYSELENGIRLIKLSGRLDMDGANAIDTEFVQYCSGDNVFVLVDLSYVNYLSSIGIPLLITTAKSMASRGGRMGLVGPQPNVKSVLDVTGVSNMLRIYHDLETATERLMSE